MLAATADRLRFSSPSTSRTSSRMFLSGWFPAPAPRARCTKTVHPDPQMRPACQPPPIRDRKIESRRTGYGEGFFSRLLKASWAKSRKRLFSILGDLVKWANTTNEEVPPRFRLASGLQRSAIGSTTAPTVSSSKPGSSRPLLLRRPRASRSTWPRE